MPDLICTVRGCGNPLSRTEGTLNCDRGHAFDQARSGYWNLLQPQDRKSVVPGDRAESVDARGRWLERGHVDELADLIGRTGDVEKLAPGSTVLDVGCGTGWFVDRLCSGRELDVCGLDLSTRAIRSAARRFPGAAWIVVNADRGLPLAADSVDLALSIFGRRPAAELARVLRPGGRLVVVVPADDDLAELREAAQGSVSEPDRIPKVVDELATTSLVSAGHQTWRRRAAHDREGVDDLMAMTYRAARHSQQNSLRDRLQGSPTVEVTLAAHVLCFEKSARSAARS